MDPVPIPNGVAEAVGGRRIVIAPPDGDLTGDIRPVEAVIVDNDVNILIELNEHDRHLAALGQPLWLTFTGGCPVFSIAFNEGQARPGEGATGAGPTPEAT